MTIVLLTYFGNHLFATLSQRRHHGYYKTTDVITLMHSL